MISVIVSVYNVEDYLHVCLNSILKQSYQDFEVICIDDGSIDSSTEILDYFSQKDSRIKVLKNNYHKGVGFSKNRGLKEAKGKYVSFLNAEDWFAPNAFEILIKNAKNNNLDVLLFNKIIFYEDSHDFGMESDYDIIFMDNFESIVFNHNDLQKSFLFNIPNESNNALYLKSLLDEKNIHFPNEKLDYGDSIFFYNVLTSAKKVSFVNNYLYNHRKRLGTSKSYDFFEEIQFVYPLINLFLENKDLFNYYKNEVLNYIFIDVLFEKYSQMDDNLKEEAFNEIQMVYRSFIKDYGLYKDIKEIIDEDTLSLFKFDDIVNDLMNYVPKISVVIPVYNVENYLNQTLNSVINQRFRDIEIICVNDGSTDNSLKILKSYAEVDNRIKVITQKNGGVGHARNVGLNHAIGDYVLFMDSDDFLVEDCLQELYLNAVSNNSDLVLFKFNKYDDNEDAFVNSGIPLDSLFGEIDYNKFTFTYKDIKNHVMNTFIAVWSKLYKKEFLDKYGITFLESISYEDVLFHIKSCLYADKISFLPKHLYNYRISNKNSLTQDSYNVFDIIEVVDSVETFLKASLFFKEFEMEFYVFKIIQLSQYISKGECEDYFNNIRSEFISLDKNENFDINDLPLKLQNTFNKVVNSNNLDEFFVFHYLILD